MEYTKPQIEQLHARHNIYFKLCRWLNHYTSIFLHCMGKNNSEMNAIPYFTSLEAPENWNTMPQAIYNKIQSPSDGFEMTVQNPFIWEDLFHVDSFMDRWMDRRRWERQQVILYICQTSSIVYRETYNSPHIWPLFLAMLSAQEHPPLAYLRLPQHSYS
jgi:hypothetical protein